VYETVDYTGSPDLRAAATAKVKSRMKYEIQIQMNKLKIFFLTEGNGSCIRCI
jgi:hypothetical protein